MTLADLIDKHADGLGMLVMLGLWIFYMRAMAR